MTKLIDFEIYDSDTIAGRLASKKVSDAPQSVGDLRPVDRRPQTSLPTPQIPDKLISADWLKPEKKEIEAWTVTNGEEVANDELILDKSLQLSPKEQGNSLVEVAIQNSKKLGLSLLNRIKSVGQSLKDPETRRQVAAEMATNALLVGGAKMAVGSAMLLTSAPVVATWAALTTTTAIVGGAIKSHKQYKAELKNDPENEGASIRGFFKHIGSHKKQFLKNAFGSAVTGAIGGALGAGIVHAVQQLDISSLFGHADVPVPAPAIKPSVAVIEPAHPSVAVPPVAVLDIDQAIAMAGDHPSPDVQAAIEAAKAGHSWGTANLAYYIYNGREGFTINHALGEKLFEQAAEKGNKSAINALAQIHGSAAPVVDPTPAPQIAPVSSSAPSPITEPSTQATDPTAEPAPLLQAAPEAPALSDKAKAAIAASGTFGAASGAGLLGKTIVDNSLGNPGKAPQRAPTAITQVVTPAAPPRIVDTCTIKEQKDAADYFSISCAAIPIAQEIRPGDAIKFVYFEGNRSSTENVYHAGSETMLTKAFEYQLRNDKRVTEDNTTYLRGIINRLRGSLSRKFGASADTAPKAAANNNESSALSRDKRFSLAP